MILKEIEITSFGGLSNIRIEFQESLNIILGPNESGKSTIFEAIKKTLFSPTNLTSTQFNKDIARFLPIGGGDTIEVSLTFKNDGGEYHLRRRWGKSRISELRLPDGSLVVDEDRIKEIVKECIGVQEGTCKTLMMTYQAGLSETIETLKDDKETLVSLGDLLRKAIMEMDGVSVDALKDRVEELYEEYLGRWDLLRGCPEKNRGIDNKWIRGVGKVLNSFYEKEKIKREFESATRYEKELDKINKEISDYLLKINNLDTYLKENKSLKEDAVKRRQINAELKGINLEYENLSKINRDWPVVDSKIAELNQILPGIRNRIDQLENEKRKIESFNRYKELFDRFKEVEKRSKELIEAEKRLDQVRKITREDLKRLKDIFNKMKEQEAALLAGRLFAKFTPKNNMELIIQRGIEAEKREYILKDTSLEIEAEGKLRISHSEWELEISSGAKFENILYEHSNLKKRYELLLKELGVNDLTEAEALNQEYEQKKKEFEMADSRYKDALGDYSYEQMKREIEEAKVSRPERDFESTLNEIAELRAQEENLKRKLEEYMQKQREYCEKYGTQENLLKILLKISSQKEEMQRELSKLRPLPSEIKDENRFIEDYERKERELLELKDEYNNLLQERIRLESTGSDRSSEEIKRELVEAEERFNRDLKKGKAIAKIKNIVENLLSEMDRDTFYGLERDIAYYIENFTHGRYQSVRMDESIPKGLKRRDGLEIPIGYLSRGTLDVLGLALRLAITKRFLGSQENFIIMDDPLVDLDPERQKMAAEILEEFSKNKQIIILTCHPSHAELFSGHNIKLS